ncbi:hypothetical protein SNEBB_009112 [Seison nebaliae]|nr:hypothetical protein SNEBB_009112 [Seison nebaliae]
MNGENIRLEREHIAELIRDYYIPYVAVITSYDVEQLCHKMGRSLIQLLQPYTPMNLDIDRSFDEDISVEFQTIKRSHTLKLNNFNVHLVDISTMETVARRNSFRRYGKDSNNEKSNEEDDKCNNQYWYYEWMKKELEKRSLTLTDNIPTQMTMESMESLFNSAIACLFFVSSAHLEPLEKFKELEKIVQQHYTTSTTISQVDTSNRVVGNEHVIDMNPRHHQHTSFIQPPNTNEGGTKIKNVLWFDTFPNIYRHFILINDDDDDPEVKHDFQEKFLRIQTYYTLTSCSLLHLKTKQTSSIDNFISLRRLMLNIVYRGLIPWCEVKMNYLANAIKTGRGLQKYWTSGMKKFFAASSRQRMLSAWTSESILNDNSNSTNNLSNSSTSQSSSNLSLSSIIGFLPQNDTAPELMLRRLADLAFMCQAYELALDNYNTLRKELNGGTTGIWFASVLEMQPMVKFMCTVCGNGGSSSFYNTNDQNMNDISKTIDEYDKRINNPNIIDILSKKYVSLKELQLFLTPKSAALFNMEKLPDYSPENYRTALHCYQQLRMYNRSLLLMIFGGEILKSEKFYLSASALYLDLAMQVNTQNIHAALFQEQSAVCQMNILPVGRLRKYSYYMALAAHRFNKCANYEDALRCYRLSAQSHKKSCQNYRWKIYKKNSIHSERRKDNWNSKQNYCYESMTSIYLKRKEFHLAKLNCEKIFEYDLKLFETKTKQLEFLKLFFQLVHETNSEEIIYLPNIFYLDHRLIYIYSSSTHPIDESDKRIVSIRRHRHDKFENQLRKMESYCLEYLLDSCQTQIFHYANVTDSAVNEIPVDLYCYHSINEMFDLKSFNSEKSSQTSNLLWLYAEEETFIQFTLENRLNVNLECENFKLLYNFVLDPNTIEEEIENQIKVEFEENSLNFDENNSKNILKLQMNAKSSGKLFIDGIEFHLSWTHQQQRDTIRCRLKLNFNRPLVFLPKRNRVRMTVNNQFHHSPPNGQLLHLDVQLQKKMKNRNIVSKSTRPHCLAINQPFIDLNENEGKETDLTQFIQEIPKINFEQFSSNKEIAIYKLANDCFEDDQTKLSFLFHCNEKPMNLVILFMSLNLTESNEILSYEITKFQQLFRVQPIIDLRFSPYHFGNKNFLNLMLRNQNQNKNQSICIRLMNLFMIHKNNIKFEFNKFSEDEGMYLSKLNDRLDYQFQIMEKKQNENSLEFSSLKDYAKFTDNKDIRHFIQHFYSNYSSILLDSSLIIFLSFIQYRLSTLSCDDSSSNNHLAVIVNYVKQSDILNHDQFHDQPISPLTSVYLAIPRRSFINDFVRRKLYPIKVRLIFQYLIPPQHTNGNGDNKIKYFVKLFQCPVKNKNRLLQNFIHYQKNGLLSFNEIFKEHKITDNFNTTIEMNENQPRLFDGKLQRYYNREFNSKSTLEQFTTKRSTQLKSEISEAFTDQIDNLDSVQLTNVTQQWEASPLIEFELDREKKNRKQLDFIAYLDRENVKQSNSSFKGDEQNRYEPVIIALEPDSDV